MHGTENVKWAGCVRVGLVELGLGSCGRKHDEGTKDMALTDRLTVLTLQLRPRCSVRAFNCYTASRFTTVTTLTGSLNLELFRPGQKSLENSAGLSWL
jgi:hypothetical protein